jgi:AraC-like DNA-binding protein
MSSFFRFQSFVLVLVTLTIIATCRTNLAAQSEDVLIKDWEVDIGRGFQKCEPAPWTLPADQGGIGATEYTGYGVYRSHVVIPGYFSGHQLAVFFISIDDADETYFNGMKIGSMGIFPKSDRIDDGYLSAWRIPRIYPLPESIIRYEKENTIEVKVFSPSGRGGLSEKALPEIGLFDHLKGKADHLTLANDIPRIVALSIFFYLFVLLLKHARNHAGRGFPKYFGQQIVNRLNPLYFIRLTTGYITRERDLIKETSFKYLCAAMAILSFSVFISHELTYESFLSLPAMKYSGYYDIPIMYLGILILFIIIHNDAFRQIEEYPGPFRFALNLATGILTHPFVFCMYTILIFFLTPHLRYNEFSARGSYIVIGISTVLLVKLAYRRAILLYVHGKKKKGIDFLHENAIYIIFISAGIASIVIFMSDTSWLNMHSMTIASFSLIFYILAMLQFQKKQVKLYSSLEFKRASDKKRYCSSESRIRRIREFIDENYSEDITRDDIAFAVGISPEELSRLFNTVIGKTIIDYIARKRIDMAAKMLAETDKTVIEIAFSSGFNSLRTFNRSFSKLMNMTPTQFRVNAETTQQEENPSNISDGLLYPGGKQV